MKCPPPVIKKPPPVVTPPPPAPVYCGFSSTCPPGEYGQSPNCSVTAPTTFPAGCNTYPAFAAPVITSLAIGAESVYGIGFPSQPLTGDFNAATGEPARTAVFAWGNNQYGQLGDTTVTSTSPTSAPAVPLFVPGNAVTQVVAGDTDACGLLADGSVHCWGMVVTNPGAIEYPSQQQISFPSSVPAPSSTTPPIVQIVHGQHHACAMTSDYQGIYCWGNNDKGQLGVNPASTPYADPVGGTAVAVAFPPGGPSFLKFIGPAAAGDSTCALADVEWPASNGRGPLHPERSLLLG